MNYSHAQIVATLGPASQEKEIIKQMIAHHMDVVRLNFSWGTHAEHADYISKTRELAQELNRRIPILQDLSGPRLKTETGHAIDLEATQVITPKDLDDLKFGLAQKVDYVAMSYVGNKNDVLEIKRHIKLLGHKTPVIAKIERAVAVEKIDEIISAADGIMVARGDLGNEVPLEQIPFIQDMIIRKCKAAVKPVITATQMMLSMKENPSPTRAEVTDVAFAIVSGSDGVMLSDETANGQYPVEAVAMMEKIVLEAEKYLKINYLNPLK
ncbi:MAG: pyruvate kinase [Patescibacteria group bacterium]